MTDLARALRPLLALGTAIAVGAIVAGVTTAAIVVRHFTDRRTT